MALLTGNDVTSGPLVIEQPVAAIVLSVKGLHGAVRAGME